MKKLCFVSASLLGALCFTASAFASVVYDNTTSPQGFFSPLIPAGSTDSSFEIGDQVNLAGSERYLTSFEFYLASNDSLPGSADVQVRLYENDGAASTPGSLIWDSGVQNDLDHVVGLNVYQLTLPRVLVPDTFTWTMQLTDRKGSRFALGPVFYDPPAIGGSDDSFWFRSVSGGTWGKSIPGTPPVDNFAAKFSASPVPEPAALILIGLGLAGIRMQKHMLNKTA